MVRISISVFRIRMLRKLRGLDRIRDLEEVPGIGSCLRFRWPPLFLMVPLNQ